jgi:hypothetical protein
MPTVSGIVHVTRHKPKLASTGKETIKGIVHVTRHKPGIHVAATEKEAAHGSVASSKPSIFGTGTVVIGPYRLDWDSTTRFYTQGVSNGVLYPQNSPGVAWSGLISVVEKGDASPNPLYIDGQKYLDDSVPGTYGGTISAFMYPDELEPCLGVIDSVSGQPKPSFGFSYQTNRELHLIYNATISPSSNQYESVSESSVPTAFSWPFATIPTDIPSARASSHIVVMLDYAEAAAVSDLLDLLYGTDENDPVLPDPATVYSLFESYTTLMITDNGDGTWTAAGPDDVVYMLDGETFEIDWPSAVLIDADTYRVYSL